MLKSHRFSIVLSLVAFFCCTAQHQHQVNGFTISPSPLSVLARGGSASASASGIASASIGLPTWTRNNSHNKQSKRNNNLQLFASTDDDDVTNYTLRDVDIRTTLSLIGGQSFLILFAIIISILLKTPNYGFGPNFHLSQSSITQGLLYTIPLGIFAYVLDKLEPFFESLQQVSKATQRSVLTVLGTTWKPKFALCAAIGLGMAAGFGEEMLFRGVMQYELALRVGGSGASIFPYGAVGVTSIIFGLLHAVTPMYAVLATLASFYFGWLYVVADNLVVPIITHGVYDIVALFYAHYTVTQMSPEEQREIAFWQGPLDKKDGDE